MSAKNQNDFTDISALDAVTMVINTAVVARNSGHPVQVNAVMAAGHAGIMILIPKYKIINGRILPIDIESDGASDE